VFVGRAAELRLLDQIVVEACSGEPASVLVRGDAGTGKTRLVTEVAGRVRRRGVRTLAGSCTMVGRASLAFAPFAEALRPVVHELAERGSGIDDAATPRLARLVAASREPVPAEDPLEADPGGAYAQLALFEEVLDTVERAASPSGLLLVIEDLHWADVSSRGLFEFLSRNLRDAAVALVGTVRTDEPDDAVFLGWLAELQRCPRAIQVDLGPLDESDLVDLLAGVLGRPVPPDLAGRVYRRSGGNAFLAEELVAAGEEGMRVPATVRNLVLARAGGLTPPGRDVLRLAAVAGSRVRHGLLAAATDLHDDVLLAAVRELAENHLLVADRSVAGYSFRHALTREAVYEDLLPGERQRLHRAVAQALRDEPSLGPSPGWAVAQAIAEHWSAAGELAPALAASVAAGDAARDVLAVAEALDQYQRALDLWDQLADPETVAGVTRRVLLESAAEAAQGGGRHDVAIRHLDAAIVELERTSPAPAELGRLYRRRGRYLLWVGRLIEWQEWTGRAAALVPSEPALPEHARVLADHAFALTGTQRYDEAARIATSAVEAARRTGSIQAEVVARCALGLSLAMTCTDSDAAIEQLDRARAVSLESGNAEDVVVAYNNLSDTLIMLGRLDEATSTAREAIAIGRRLGVLPGLLAWNVLNRATAQFLAGGWDECEEALQGLDDPLVGGLTKSWGFALAALLAATRGHEDAAAAAIAAASRLDVRDTQNEALLLAARARLALTAGDREVARSAALEGLESVAGSETEPDGVAVVVLASLGLQIEADRAELGRARRDPGATHAAVESTRSVAALALASRARVAAVAHRPEVTRAQEAMGDAEIGRAEGRSDADAWRTTADLVRLLADRYGTAYARYREAEAVLATRCDRARAVDALIAAQATAHQLGAQPLVQEIEGLARRARIELADEPPPATSTPPSAAPLADLGLTERELEVLRLLAAGRTNPQIGEALYISRKTASHHVSRILTKLGVTTRVEAAGVAHRAGLSADDASPK
jgi:predicted ATPase/DNA-binding NarL/FixJ family response regulator